MKWFLHDKGLILLLIFITVVVFAVGGVYFDSIAVEQTTTTEAETTTTNAATDVTTAANTDPHFVSYDETTRVLELKTNGFHGYIYVEFTLNDTLDGVASYQIKTSTETYDDSHNDNYTGGPVPSVETSILDQYMADTSPVDGVAGATETSNSILEMLVALDEFIASLNGGN
ncbi:MAG: FMN-binding protein [Bacilli bacterium]|nr:FMN-binding protein [Bacilli bacterium]MBN2876366.1 FMN-binding protein [Bacilli bacterium]